MNKIKAAVNETKTFFRMVFQIKKTEIKNKKEDVITCMDL